MFPLCSPGQPTKHQVGCPNGCPQWPTARNPNLLSGSPHPASAREQPRESLSTVVRPTAE
jgi:hypothetical protein